MYSKYKGITDKDYVLTPPPGYDGSRFRRRSDGRDDAFLLYSDEVKRQPPFEKAQCCEEKAAGHSEDCPCEKAEEDCSVSPCCEECPMPQKKPKEEAGILSFLQGIDGEDILLIALILLLANDSKAGIDTILILALLLCLA